jgi:hypothetical protein
MSARFDRHYEARAVGAVIVLELATSDLLGKRPSANARWLFLDSAPSALRSE